MGSVAGAAPHRRFGRAPMPPLRHRRLRRRQSLRVPHPVAHRARVRSRRGAARRAAHAGRGMRLAIIRQRYTPYGGAERFVEAALEALLERGVAISLYTRAWPQTKLQLIEPILCDPPYLGRLWRDWSFARSVCRTIAGRPPELVQSHERLLCCDVYRAGDGVHQVWLEERLRDASTVARWLVEWNPYHRYVLAMERQLFAS